MSDEIKDDEFSEYMKEVRESADLYLELGLSIIPISLTEKKPAIAWKEYQSRGLGDVYKRQSVKTADRRGS